MKKLSIYLEERFNQSIITIFILTVALFFVVKFYPIARSYVELKYRIWFRDQVPKVFVSIVPFSVEPEAWKTLCQEGKIFEGKEFSEEVGKAIIKIGFYNPVLGIMERAEKAERFCQDFRIYQIGLYLSREAGKPIQFFYPSRNQ